jgi:NAD(P)-dependent dehydrogenase (short-subunit alcohol dehydrogenase family)
MMDHQFDAKSTVDEVLSGVDLKGKRIFVTGVSSGIGLEVARALAAHGADVVGTVMNRENGEKVAGPIKEAAKTSGGRLELVDLDLASLRNIRACSDALLSDGRLLDVIIANAGILGMPFGQTEDGFERHFGTNYLGHFALLQQIAPLLPEGGRLVTTSSQAHRTTDVDIDDPNFERRPYDKWAAYAQSKTANALFAVEFDRRHRDRGVHAASVEPGMSATGLARVLSEDEKQEIFASVDKARAEANLPPEEMKSVAQAAATPVWAAIVAGADQIVGRYIENCAVAPVNDTPNPFADGARSYALDADKAKRLGTKSEEWIEAGYARIAKDDAAQASYFLSKHVIRTVS